MSAIHQRRGRKETLGLERFSRAERETLASRDQGAGIEGIVAQTLIP